MDNPSAPNPTHRYCLGDVSIFDEKPSARRIADVGHHIWGLGLSKDLVYSSTISGSLVANTKEGDDRWSYQAPDSIKKSPTVSDGSVYFGSNNGSLYAVDVADGREQWEFQAWGQILSTPAVADGIVYVTTRPGRVYGIDVETGSKSWEFNPEEATGPSMSSPLVFDGTVFVGNANSMIYALDSQSGDEIWSFETDGPVQSSAAVSDGTVYIGNQEGSVYALDAETGSEEWITRTDGEVFRSVAVSGESVFVASDELLSIGARDGEINWAFDYEGRQSTPPTVSRNLVYIGCEGGVVAVDRDTGVEAWRVADPDNPFAPITATAHQMFVGDRSDDVYLLE
jgi:outer membrane protein assembly factor BamB